MPRRIVKPVNNYIYHVYNRGVARQSTFTNPEEYKRAIELIGYYRFAKPPLRYSIFSKHTPQLQKQIIDNLNTANELLVSILTFVLMPNHFHFTLKQIKDNGIEQFISLFTNSYTKYVNTKNNRTGPLFQGRYKLVLVDSTEQFIHLARYHHLNPYTACIVSTLDQLTDYPYSSLPTYLRKKSYEFVDTEILAGHFKSIAAHKKFVFAQADYQKKLGRIRKLILEQPSKFKAKHPRRG